MSRDNLYAGLFTVGEFVEVDNGAFKGYIESKRGTTIEDLVVDVRENVNQQLIQDISTTRVTVVPIITAFTTRSGTTCLVPPPPLLPPSASNTTTTTSAAPSTNTTSSSTSSNQNTTISREKNKFHSALHKCYSWTKYNTSNKLYQFLLQGKERAKGWLRNIINEENDDVDPKSNLKEDESQLLTVVSALFSGYRNDAMELKGHCELTQHAFGIGCSTHALLLKKFVRTGYTMKRKIHKDTGKCVFNSPQKR